MGTGAAFRTTKWKLFVEDYKVNIQREFGPGLVDFTEETTRTFNGEKEISGLFKSSLNLAFVTPAKQIPQLVLCCLYVFV